MLTTPALSPNTTRFAFSYRSMFNVVVLHKTFGSDPDGAGSETGRIGAEAEEEP